MNIYQKLKRILVCLQLAKWVFFIYYIDYRSCASIDFDYSEKIVYDQKLL